jgi:thioester reductase-like protein
VDISEIVHCAAQVNAVLPYEMLRRANVLGTAHVLALQRLSGARLTHVSSAAVFNAYPTPEGGFESTFELDWTSALCWESGLEWWRDAGADGANGMLLVL